jgi:nicotinamidase-related amidase
MNATIDPAHTALLVMDYQPAVLGSLSEAEDLLARAGDAIAAVRRHGGHVGYVRVGFEDGDLEAIPEHSPMAQAAAAMGDRLHARSPATQVHASVAPEPGDIVVRKTRVGAFSTTDLDERLRAAGVTTLVLAGVSTSGVVLSTVRDAHDRDYRVLVLSDATADPQPHVHEFLTGHIFPRQADVITVERLGRLLTGTTDEAR